MKHRKSTNFAQVTVGSFHLFLLLMKAYCAYPGHEHRAQIISKTSIDGNGKCDNLRWGINYCDRYVLTYFHADYEYGESAVASGCQCALATVFLYMLSQDILSIGA